MSELQPRKVFALAFACEPGRGSEPGVGYTFAEALARLSIESNREFTLLTRPHTAPSVLAAIEQSVGPNRLHVLPISIPMWIVHLTRRKRVRFAYVIWQLCAVFAIHKETRHTRESFVVHHITFATEALPTFESLLGARAVRILGPAGSSQQLNMSGNTFSSMRLRHGLRRLIGTVNLNGAALAIAANNIVAKSYREMGAKNVEVEPNIVISSQEASQANKLKTNYDWGNHELIAVGVLQERKRLHLALEALSLITDVDCRLLIIGNGPMESKLKQQVVSLGLEGRVTFAGKLNRAETLSLMAGAKILVHPARQEGSAWVVGEAQAVGTIPIVIAGSGAETAVQLGGSGLVVENSPESLAAGILFALGSDCTPSSRWSSSRLPGLLEDWYSKA